MMVNYNGYDSSIYEAGIRDQRTFICVNTTSYEGNGVRDKKTMNVVFLKTFDTGTRDIKTCNTIIFPVFAGDSGLRNSNEFNAFEYWGGGNEPPRRKPLEISWTKPKK